MGTDFLGDIFLFIEVMDAVRVFKGYALVRQSLIETRLVAVRSIPCWFYLVRVKKNHFHTLRSGTARQRRCLGPTSMRRRFSSKQRWVIIQEFKSGHFRQPKPRKPDSLDLLKRA